MIMSIPVVREVLRFMLSALIVAGVSSGHSQPARTDTGTLIKGTPAARTPDATASSDAAPQRSIYGSMLEEGENTTGPLVLQAGTYAVFHTSDGDFLVRLFAREAPVTVTNFIELAQGRKTWKHPVTLIDSNRPLYNNTTIYRIIPNSMIFGGDPINKGQADSGTLLPIETSPDLKFDQPGYIAMDGNGNKASGSRWFIALRPFPERTGNYTIFGKVVGGLDVVRAISNKPTRRPQSPLDPTLLSSVEIIEIPQGKRTRASFQKEEGRQVLTIDKRFEDAAPEPQASPLPADASTTTSSESTTATAASQGTTTATP